MEKKVDMLRRVEMETSEEWMKWVKEIPSLTFPSGVKVQIIPPFLGALARFKVLDENDPNIEVSVYFDAHEALGYFAGQPHWEIYPDKDDNNTRFGLDQGDEMMEAIVLSIKTQKDKKNATI